jgi:hypothetical protein
MHGPLVGRDERQILLPTRPEGRKKRQRRSCSYCFQSWFVVWVWGGVYEETRLGVVIRQSNTVPVLSFASSRTWHVDRHTGVYHPLLSSLVIVQ